MKIQKIIFAVVVACMFLTSCKKEIKTENSVVAKDAKIEQFAMNISGMTCEIGCAKKINKDLSKKEGVLEAKVIFNDSVATVKFDANKTNKAELLAFVEGIAGGDLYRASENKEYKMCKPDCKKECSAKAKAEKKECKSDCKKECSAKTKAEKEACKLDCKKECSTKTKAEGKACKPDCKKECCTAKKG